MNERIQELAQEAGLIAKEYNGFDRTTMTPAEKKFAELIVKECSQLLSHKDDRNTPASHIYLLACFGLH